MSTCTHPGAHVHGLIGSGPAAVASEETRLALKPVEWGLVVCGRGCLRWRSRILW